MRRSLPVLNAGRDALDLIEIAIPCQVPWDGMPGDEQVRHCGTCQQNVYNVSSYTRAEAMKLLRARACLRVYRRPDNTVVTSDCRARLRAARKRGLLIFAGALVVVLWAQICAQFVGLMGLRRVIGSRETSGMAVGPASPPAPRIPVPGQLVLPAPRMEAGKPTMGDWIGPDEPAPTRPKRHIGKIKRVPETPDRGPFRGMEVRDE